MVVSPPAALGGSVAPALKRVGFVAAAAAAATTGGAGGPRATLSRVWGIRSRAARKAVAITAMAAGVSAYADFRQCRGTSAAPPSASFTLAPAAVCAAVR